jgi:hypothetical protein
MAGSSSTSDNDVWVFARQGAQTVLVGRQTHDETNGAHTVVTHDVEHDGHTLRVWVSDGLAWGCRTCGRADLVAGQTCALIDAYNDTVCPLP